MPGMEHHRLPAPLRVPCAATSGTCPVFAANARSASSVAHVPAATTAAHTIAHVPRTLQFQTVGKLHTAALTLRVG